MGVSPLSGMPPPKRAKEQAAAASDPGNDHMNDAEQRELQMALQASLEDVPAAARDDGAGPSQVPEAMRESLPPEPVKTAAEVMQEAKEELGEEPGQGVEGSCRIGLRLPNG